MQDPKIAKKLPSGHHRTTLFGYIFATKARIDNQKKNLLDSNTASTRRYNMVNFGPLYNGWDPLASLGQPSKVQPVSHLGFVTAPTSHNGGQQNFAECLAVSWGCAGTLYIHFWGLLLPNGILPAAKIHFASKSSVLLYWQRYCTAREQRPSAKLCGLVQGMELGNFRRGRHLYSAGGNHVWHRPTFYFEHFLTRMCGTIIWYPDSPEFPPAMSMPDICSRLMWKMPLLYRWCPLWLCYLCSFISCLWGFVLVSQGLASNSQSAGVGWWMIAPWFSSCACSTREPLRMKWYKFVWARTTHWHQAQKIIHRPDPFLTHRQTETPLGQLMTLLQSTNHSAKAAVTNDTMPVFCVFKFSSQMAWLLSCVPYKTGHFGDVLPSQSLG